MKLFKALVIIAITVLSSSCETKEEAARNNISRTWKVGSVTRNGADDTAAYNQNRSNYRISFNKEGTFMESYTPFGSSTPTTINGTFSINTNVTQMNLESDFQSRAFTIDQLDEGNLILIDLGSSDDLRIFHIPE